MTDHLITIPMRLRRCLNAALAEYRLERQDSERYGEGWMTLDSTNSGGGVFGTEADGQRHYDKTVMFRALESFDADHDWHAYDWHTLNGSAEDRVRQMWSWRKEHEAACAALARDPIHAVAQALAKGFRP